MNSPFLLAQIILALVSVGGAAVAWLRFYSLREKVDSNYSRLMGMQSKLQHDETKVRDLVEDHIPRVIERMEDTGGGGMDDEMMMQMMMGMMGQQQAQQPQQPQQQRPENPELVPGVDEETENNQEPSPNGSGSGILDTIADLEADQASP